MSRIRFNSAELMIEGAENQVLPWDSVLEVFAYKDDVFSYDIICIGFRLNDQGTYVRIDEEYEGYKSLIDYLPHVFQGIRSDWFREVAHPAFETCLVTLWGNAKIRTLWMTE